MRNNEIIYHEEENNNLRSFFCTTVQPTDKILNGRTIPEIESNIKFLLNVLERIREKPMVILYVTATKARLQIAREEALQSPLLLPDEEKDLQSTAGNLLHSAFPS